MAAEVPASEVLCEATEYLSKLGSNLRTRSENLKDKKIRKDKLNNVLALQKAASKVLLICELSKKSLENVETGVREVLQQIDKAQTHNGAKTGTSSESVDKSHKESKYYYFEYKTRKLRMRKKISLKHYTSVKVFAKRIPKTMLEKYPVFYDCKLYRKRKREEKMQNVCNETGITSKVENSDKLDGSVECVKKLSEPIIDIPDSPNSVKKIIENEEIDSSVVIIPDTPELKRFHEDDNSNDKVKNKNDLNQNTSPIRRVSEDTNSKSHDKSEYKIDKNKDKSHTSRKMSEDKVKHRKMSEASNKSGKEDGKKRFRKLQIIDDSSEDEKSQPNNEEKFVEKSASDKEGKVDDNTHPEPEHKKRKCTNNDDELQKDEIPETTAISDEDENKQNDSDSEKKPLIKCVSLSKLLKPGVLEKNGIGPKTKQTDKEKNKKSELNVNKKSEALLRKEREEKEYWAQKRKEVSLFKPKTCVINITRLPDLSIDYLDKMSLKKITCRGKILCESKSTTDLHSKSSEDEEIESNKKNDAMETSKRKRSTEVDQTKDASEPDNDLIAEANKVKNALLFESDSEGDPDLNSEKQTKEIADMVKNSLLRDSDDSKDSETKNNAEETEKNDLISNEINSDEESGDRMSKNNEEKSQNDDTTLNEVNDDQESGGEDPETTNNKQESEKHDTTSNKVNSDHQSSDDDSKTKNKEDAEKSDSKNSDHASDIPGDKNDDLVKKSLSEKSEHSRSEKTPEKPYNSSGDEKANTPLSMRRASNSVTPQSKKKRLRESVHAKKMLLTYSSSSDTEDEKLKGVLKEIKDALLHGSDEENDTKKKDPKSGESSSSSEDIMKKVKKKILEDSDDEKHSKRPKRKRKKQRKKIPSENSDQSDTSSNKMVRSKSKPGNCSSQNSDAQDPNDKDIDGLTNLDTLNKARSHRRQSDGSDQTESSDRQSKSSKKTAKRTGLICEEMLKAESSSEPPSGDDNQDIETDLPTVTIPNFNGDGDHQVKEDLLGESDSSASHNEDTNKDDSESEEKALNARRRKANAISSDSEVGSSRKKDVDVKMSDFEDSDDDTSEAGKRTKRKKKKTSDSDGSARDSSTEGGKKKRRRIKTIKDSDASGSESETEGRNKHGRKNIRKVMGKNQLEEATKKAARQEKERIARIAERQKLYNNMQFDESGKPDEVVLEKVVLDFDPETKEPLIEVDRGLVKKLKPHQANGIKFMWDACFESVKRIKKDRGSGCILAHCMGLGKTLQVVSLTHTLLTHGDLTRVNRVLVVCPLSTVLNWVNEFKMWLKHAVTDYEVEVYELSRFKQNSERAFQLSQWFTHGGVCVLGYEMFRNLSADNVKKFKKKMLKNFQEALVDPGPDLVVCDEGHLLKNEKTSLSQSMNKVKTLRRIVLTGTPLQNNLKEYYCMVQFVKPNLLGKYNEYLNRFVNPITNGQYTDSTEHDIKIMKRRSHVLHKMLDGAVQRRDYGVLAPFLPPKHEYVLFITLSEVQVKLYQHYLDNFSRQPLPGKSSGFLFPDFQSLQRIWTHPLVLKYNSERYEIMQQKKRDKEEDSEGSLVDFIDDDTVSEEDTTDESTDDSSDMSDDSRKKSKKKKKSSKKSKNKDKEAKGGDGPARGRRGTRANPIDQDDEDEQDDIIEVKNENPTEWWIKLVVEDELEDMRNSHKLILLFDILRQCDTIGDKLLVFSQSLYSLDLIEHFLGKVDEATQEGRIDEKLGGHVGSWSPGVDYFRLDGSTSCENRSIWCKNFNREDNPRARLFLISTRAGGLGINLVAANRVVIFDVSWNPSHDVQSIFRVYRFGQKKPCYVYRFLAMGTMEEKIYERQVTKQAISKRVIDEQQIDRHYAENDLAELYKFEPTPPSPRPIPPLPKDRLFAEMLREHEAQIYKYHEHDSLLENKEEETLSEEERKAAWEDFENEKNRPPPAPYSPWTMHNGMMPGLLAQQQQYAAAYAALAATLRKEAPNISDDQIKAMLPLIYNANPQMFGGYDYGLMQKMNELYKYTNMSGMMNPGMMMNPGVMNAASGTGGMSGMGGASGLQYEPPWQRQQQQQQQMRLQQLMQQQNPMGAKFYAGGLGSRDPVAMALQQQRAREIMLGGASSRPRGRPPLQPRAPPPASDVVNLDSD